MVLFFNARGELVYSSIPDTPLRQGSLKANNITVVGPFSPSSILTVDFLLPNGQAIGHSFVTDSGSEYDMTAVTNYENSGYTVDGATLYAWTYSLNSAVTAIGGTLSIVVKVNAGGESGESGEILPLEPVNVNIDNGIPNIPTTPTIPQDAEAFYGEVIEFLSGTANAEVKAEAAAQLAKTAQAEAEAAARDAEATLADTVKKNTDGNPEINQRINSSVSIVENLTVNGDLTVRGTTTTVTHEELAVEDAYIVTNARADMPLEGTSGLIIDTGVPIDNGLASEGYGILYDTEKDAVMLGKGYYYDGGNGLTFNYGYREGQAIVTRDESLGESESGTVPVWDGDNHTLTSSGKTLNDFVPTNASALTATRQLYGKDSSGNVGLASVGNVVEAFSNGKIPIPSYLTSTDGTPNYPPTSSNIPLCLWTGDPVFPYNAVSKHYADEHYVPIQTGSGTRVYTATNGEQGFQYFAPNVNPYYIVQRSSTGNILVPETPEIDNHAINKGYADTHYLAIRTNSTAYPQAYVKNSDGTQIVINVSPSALANAVIQRTNDRNIRLPDQITTPPDNANYAVSKAYGDANYIKRNTTTAGSYLYAHVNGEEKIAPYGTVINGGYVVQRTGTGNVRLPDQVTTPPANVDEAISKAYGDANYVPLKTNTTALAQVYAKETDGTFKMHNITAGATAYAIPQRLDDTTIIAGTLDAITNSTRTNICVSKAYVDNLVSNAITNAASNPPTSNVYKHDVAISDGGNLTVYLTLYNASSIALDESALARLITSPTNAIEVDESSVPVYTSIIVTSITSTNDTIYYAASGNATSAEFSIDSVVDTVTSLSAIV